MAPFALILLASLLALTLTSAEDLQNCGEARYYPSAYTCYKGNQLCPVMDGQPTLACGNACYSPDMYRCNRGRLGLIPFAEGPFTMTAQSSRPAINGKTIHACGRHFFVGLDAGCTYCPSVVGDLCARTTKDTVLYPGGGMNVIVPGGQQWYVEADGALGYTGAHSAYIPPGSGYAGQHVTVYEDGYFEYQGAPHYWLACPSDNGSYQVFALRPELQQPAGCIQMKIVTQDWAGEVAAWQYT